jgi:hypothetical protein
VRRLLILTGRNGESEARLGSRTGRNGAGYFYVASGDEAGGKGYIRDMTREEFIEVLEEKGYSYEIEGDNLVVVDDWNVDLRSLETISPGVVFSNEGYVSLESLKTLPPDVVFKNEGDVWLESLVGGPFEDWRGNIEGINNKKLLNFMISKGVFI